MYQFINNPNNPNKTIKTNSQEGRQLLRNYCKNMRMNCVVNSLKGGSEGSVPQCKCNIPMKRFIVKKNSPNKGRSFFSCRKCRSFKWDNSIDKNTRDINKILTQMNIEGEVSNFIINIGSFNNLLLSTLSKSVEQHTENKKQTKTKKTKKRNKKMIFMAGSPGSGKSTLLKKLGLFDDFVIVNPDDWYVKSLKKRGLTLDMRNIDVKDRTRWDIFIRALNSAKDMAEELSRNEKEFIIDGTSGNYKYIHKLATKYKKMGYSIAMIYVSTSLEESISRNNKRGDNGGRRLQETIIEKSWKSVQKHCRKYDELFGNNFFFIDNTTDVDLDSKGNTGKSIRDKIQGFID